MNTQNQEVPAEGDNDETSLETAVIWLVNALIKVAGRYLTKVILDSLRP